MKKFDAFTPEQMLCWCPSCDNQLRAESQDVVTDTAKQRISVTRFLATQIDRMKLAQPVPMKVVLHVHGGFAEQEADGVDARDLLAQIPGLTIIDMPACKELGRHCSEAAVSGFGKDRYPGAMNDWATEARRRGATHVATIYHSCHRHLLLAQRGLSDQEKLPVVNYLTLLARALGIAQRQDMFAQLSQNDDIEAMMTTVAPNIRALDLKPDQAQRALTSQFRR